MVTTHKINRQLPAIVQTTPEIMALVARVRQDRRNPRGTRTIVQAHGRRPTTCFIRTTRCTPS